MEKDDRDYVESISSVRGLVNALIISVFFWGVVLTATAALVGALG